MIRYLAALALFTATIAPAQQEGPTPTQALVAVESKTHQAPTPQSLTLKLNNRETPLTSFARIPPTGAQIALLIDEGLRTSVGRQLNDLRSFVQNLPQGTEILIGYMQNGRVVPTQDFTTDHAAAAKTIRIPQSIPGGSASPYFCLSEFAKNWPATSSDGTTHKARFVLMLTNGVDPYNGSTSPSNQSSPYVDSAIRDAQRAGAAVYSIYYGDAGFGGQNASFSGQSYLAQVAEGTGGRAYFQGTSSPVSVAPFLKQFRDSIAETYVATFPAPARSDFVRIKLSTSLPGTKVRSADQVRPGTRILTGGQ